MAAEPRRGGQLAPLRLSDYQPASMLRVAATQVEHPRFPVLDFHTHLSWSKDDANLYLATPDALLPVMERRRIRSLVNLTGGCGEGLKDAVDRFDRRYPGRFFTFAEPWWSRAEERGYATLQADLLEQAKAHGARGVKVLKTLGLFLRDNSGKLIAVDDPRFDPMWEACAALGFPVAIHVSDPVAFFEPVDRFNERYEELHNHPDWSFDGNGYPGNADLLAARDRVIARHPRTTFVGLHVGNCSEDLEGVAQALDRFPNLYVDFAARVGELGRQPRTARRFFEAYQDRILFGTDATPDGREYPQQHFCDDLYRIYYRFLETEDEYFDYAPSPVPPQGRWRIYGLGLPEEILHKVYWRNAARLLGVEP